MYFRQFHDTTSAAMSYLIADTASRVAAAIDPTPAPCQGLVLKALLAEDARPYQWLSTSLTSVMPAHVVYAKVDHRPAGL